MKSRFFLLGGCFLVGGAMACFDTVRGQGIERYSTSGELLARQLKEDNSNQDYNLKLGPVSVRVEAELRADFDDNIGVSHDHRMADMVVTPLVTFHGRGQISDLNSVNFNIGLGYEAYLFNSRYNNLVLAPNSAANFNFFIGDVTVNLHEAFSYQQDPVSIGQLSNQVRLIRFTNDVGISAKWDLNAFILDLDYTHSNFWVTQSIYNYLTNQSDTLSPRVTYHVNSQIDTGLSGSFSTVRYEKPIQNDYTSESFGPFVTAQVSDNLSLTAQAGGYLAQYDRGGLNRDTQDVASYYGSAAFNHRINETLSQSLTFGHEFLPGLTSNFTERVYATYGDVWKPTSSIQVDAKLWWENLADSNAAISEKSDRYAISINLQDNVTEKATLLVGYQYILKETNLSYLGYYQNVGTLGLRYHF